MLLSLPINKAQVIEKMSYTLDEIKKKASGYDKAENFNPKRVGKNTPKPAAKT